MNGPWAEVPAALVIAGAVLLFLLETAFSIVLIAASALNRVALHRLGSEDDGSRRYLETIREPLSTHRTATHLARQLCLLGAALQDRRQSVFLRPGAWISHAPSLARPGCIEHGRRHQPSRSNTAARPWPPPIHMVSSP